MADLDPKNQTPPAPVQQPPAPGPGPATHVLPNPISASADVAARLAAPKTSRSAEDVLGSLEGVDGRLGARRVRCILKPDHPLDHTTYGGVQFAKFTEIVSGGGAVRVPQPGALNELSNDDVARIVADARDCIARFYPGGKDTNGAARRGRGFEYRVSLVGENFVQRGDRPTYAPPRVVVNGEKRWVPLGVSDAQAAKQLGVSELDVNEARREADVRSLIELEFDPTPMTEIPDSLERAISMARDARDAVMALPKRGDPEANAYGRAVALDVNGRPSGGGVSPAAPGSRYAGDPASGVSDEAQAQAAIAGTADPRNGIPALSPSPDQGLARDAGIKVSGTGRPSRR